jgi:uncharacterized membrane protein YGL010W
MNIEINWLAVVFATCAGMVVAGTWYSKAFGEQWRKLTGVTAADSKRAGSTPLVLTLLANFTTACLLAAAISVFAAQLDSSMIMTSLLVGFFSWLGFSATTLLTHNAFELKNPKLTLINSGYQLTLFLLMALVIGLFGA